MKYNPINILFALAFFLPILKGFIVKFNSQNLKEDLIEVIKSISFVISLILGIYVTRRIFIYHDWNIVDLLPENLISFLDARPMIVYIFILPIIIYIIYKLVFIIIEFLNLISIYPILDTMEKFFRNKRQFIRRLMGAIFEIPKAICYILLLSFALNFLSVINLSAPINKQLQGSNIYNYMCKEIVIPIANSKLAKQLPEVINNSLKVEIKQNIPSNSSQNKNNSKSNQIVYYNGVTLDEGIKSNKEIDSFAKKLVQDQKTDKAKARAIYNWIGANIEYDYDKANRVLSSDFNISSGAIPTYKTKKGICFDYSCLYVAMCRSAGLKVRMVTGDGFNGISWVSHAWNQVYVSEENKWINVDTTFYKGGNYFNSRRFELDHRGDKIIGEW